MRAKCSSHATGMIPKKKPVGVEVCPAVFVCAQLLCVRECAVVYVHLSLQACLSVHSA